MGKILRVIDPFFTVEVGDTFVLSEDGKNYVADRSEEFHTSTDENDLVSSFSSSFKISPKWAKQLIEDGFLEEASELEKTEKSFINVFDEIDTLLVKYQAELNDIPSTMKDAPECLRVEKTAVLSNMIKLLTHLKSLRK